MHCGPEFSMQTPLDQVFPYAQSTPWRYPNAGAFAGTLECVSKLIKELIFDMPNGSFPEEGNDQGRLHFNKMILKTPD